MIYLNNTKPNLFGTLVCREGFAPANLVISPGINEIESEYWNELKLNPIVKKYLDEGIFKVVIEGGEAETIADDESLASLHHTQAQKLIKDTLNLNLLEKWKNNETRQAVLKSIEQQISKLTVTQEKQGETFL